MHQERQAILSLVALGRITPAEAERLLAVSNMGREELWGIVVCIAACLGQLLPVLTHLAQSLAPAMHHGLATTTYWMGRVL